ncbi:F-box domain, Leucine-rich repeat domain, L domain-like protein [Artemisia annua]|uniref:F-box domain, Leucine-rich repeat domain, L domain-like protein n=1 Tax=Artemisia annua TaxID=35608 RepID=A0A2U1PMU2_ARTAN|nr:F-box domain, Leucine-rich repeat domain, L domain-like protein [Artemisia annua]
MDSQNKRMTMHVGVDRLSSLPDDLICKILSSFSIRFVIQASVLSSRWRYIWTSMLNLSFSSQEFSRLLDFEKFLVHVLSSCNNQVQVSLNLRGSVHMPTVIRILKLAFSHNVQQLTYKLLPDKKHLIHDLPLSCFVSQSLKHLTLIGYTKAGSFLMPTSTWELPALTTLHLNEVKLYDDNIAKCVSFISKCTNLKSLTLNNCYRGQNGLTISHPQLSNLTLEKLNTERNPLNVVNVVAPQLQNLSIINCGGEHIVSAPELTSLIYKNHALKLSVVSNLYSLKKVDLCVSNYPYTEDSHKLLSLLQQFNKVKFLTLSLEIIELLSSPLTLISHQPSPFVNLTSLRIYPELYDEPRFKNVMSSEVKNYLLDGSPKATLEMVSRKDIRAVRDAALAENLMAELKLLLDEEKVPLKCNNENMSQRPVDMSRIREHIQSCFSKMHTQMYHGEQKINSILSLLEHIKGLLRQLPVSKKAEMQPRFSCLSTEANNVIKRLWDHMKFEHDLLETSFDLSLLDLGKEVQACF